MNGYRAELSAFIQGIYEGEKKVLVDGAVGQMRTTASVKYVNTVEESRTILSETVTQEPVDRIILVGTGEGASSKMPPSATASSSPPRAKC